MTDEARLPGYYWVRFKVSPEHWEIASWERYRAWFSAGDEMEYDSDALAEIDERRIEREPPQRPSMVGP